MRFDMELQHDVMDELNWEHNVEAAHIGVAVKDGIVTLSGYVDSFAKKVAAEQAANRVFGIKGVISKLDVKLATSPRKTDEDIARVAATILEWNASIPQNRINIKVQNGQVTLNGEVDWDYQKDMAENAIRSLRGVVGINNQIAVKLAPSSQDVISEIEHAFERNALLDARRLTVEKHDNVVIIAGSVSSWAEKEEAELVASAAPGVSAVINNIVIYP